MFLLYFFLVLPEMYRCTISLAMLLIAFLKAETIIPTKLTSLHARFLINPSLLVSTEELSVAY